MHFLCGFSRVKNRWTYRRRELLKITCLVPGRSGFANQGKIMRAEPAEVGEMKNFPGKRIFNDYMDRVKVFEEPLTGEEIRGIVGKEAGQNEGG
ncbi:MAG TPA: hypothetical protein VNS58_11590 [Puia sp.]|nr:hypothetical protein [Puia sp.]